MPETSRRLELPTKGYLWYKAMQDVGYEFGPGFQKQTEIECIAGQAKTKSFVHLVNSPAPHSQSFYPVHPAALDGCLQTAAPSLWKGHRSDVDAVLVPTVIDHMVIRVPSQSLESGFSTAASAYNGVGRREDPVSHHSNITVYDCNTGSKFLEVSGLRYGRLDARSTNARASKICKAVWRPDVSFLNMKNRHRYLFAARSRLLHHQCSQLKLTNFENFMNLAAHRNPNMRVLEVVASKDDPKSIWLGDGAAEAPRRALKQLTLLTVDSDGVQAAQERYARSTHVHVGSLEAFLISSDEMSSEGFDLCILHSNTGHFMAQWGKVKTLIRDGALLVHPQGDSKPSTEIDGHSSTFLNDHYDMYADCNDSVGDSSYGSTSKTTAPSASANGLIGIRSDLDWQYFGFDAAAGVTSLLFQKDPGPIRSKAVTFVTMQPNRGASKKSRTLEDYLAGQGWRLTKHNAISNPSHVCEDGLMIIADELDESLFRSLDSQTWQCVQWLLQLPNQKLWLCSGGSYGVTMPEMSMIFGIARTLRAEDPELALVTMDLDPDFDQCSCEAVESVLEKFCSTSPTSAHDMELVERNGVIFTSRICVDDDRSRSVTSNDVQLEDSDTHFHNATGQVSLRSEQLGVLDSLRWFGSPMPTCEKPLEQAHFVEIEIYATGLNFKDVSVAMGLVPENAHLLGLEGAGIVRRAGPQAHGFKTGDRVLIIKRGTFANRLQVSVDGTHKIPDWMSFEEASTLAVVYGVCILSFFELTNVTAGQTVLIHSGAGGVGIAAIQLCQYLGAQVFTTAGTQEKREYLSKRFGIPAQSIFDSRSVHFAQQLMTQTNGKGVDVILNSSTGPLLGETWRCIADGGTMIEIGKRDILERNALSMEPFGRNASFKAIDMSHPSVPDSTIARVLSKMFSLINDGHIKPITPMNVFSYQDIKSAFRFMRTGNHTGKIVVSDGVDADVRLPTCAGKAPLQLHSNVAYLVVGGMKGLCGSVARYLARCGGTQIVVMSRSGAEDDQSRLILRDTAALGCTLTVVKGDVSVLADVEKAFQSVSVPISGIVQGAMILRVSRPQLPHLSPTKMLTRQIAGQDLILNDPRGLHGRHDS